MINRATNLGQMRHTSGLASSKLMERELSGGIIEVYALPSSADSAHCLSYIMRVRPCGFMLFFSISVHHQVVAYTLCGG